MTNVHHLKLLHADRASTDCAIIEEHLEAIHARLARVPTRVEIARTALAIMVGAAGLVILWLEAFWRHGL